jgi:hypothetical protein
LLGCYISGESKLNDYLHFSTGDQKKKIEALAHYAVMKTTEEKKNKKKQNYNFFSLLKFNKTASRTGNEDFFYIFFNTLVPKQCWKKKEN